MNKKILYYVLGVIGLLAIIAGVFLLTTNIKNNEIIENDIIDETNNVETDLGEDDISEDVENETIEDEEETFDNEEDEDPEHFACTLEWMPLCGTDGITYGNQCMADGMKAEIAYEGVCEYEDDIRVITCEENNGEIDIRETDAGEYYVCVFEDNSECETWKLINGECNAGDYVFETRTCTREYMPVCGVNGVTYSNACVAGDIPIEYEGYCN